MLEAYNTRRNYSARNKNNKIRSQVYLKTCIKLFVKDCILQRIAIDFCKNSSKKKFVKNAIYFWLTNKRLLQINKYILNINCFALI